MSILNALAPFGLVFPAFGGTIKVPGVGVVTQVPGPVLQPLITQQCRTMRRGVRLLCGELERNSGLFVCPNQSVADQVEDLIERELKLFRARTLPELVRDWNDGVKTQAAALGGQAGAWLLNNALTPDSLPSKVKFVFDPTPSVVLTSAHYATCVGVQASALVAETCMSRRLGEYERAVKRAAQLREAAAVMSAWDGGLGARAAEVLRAMAAAPIDDAGRNVAKDFGAGMRSLVDMSDSTLIQWLEFHTAKPAPGQAPAPAPAPEAKPAPVTTPAPEAKPAPVLPKRDVNHADGTLDMGLTAGATGPAPVLAAPGAKAAPTDLDMGLSRFGWDVPPTLTMGQLRWLAAELARLLK